MSQKSKNESSHRQFWENPNIVYPNGASLMRPMKIPGSSRGKLAILLIAACIIAAAMVMMYIGSLPTISQDEKDQIQQALSKKVSLDLPTLISYVDLDDTQITDKLNGTGETFYEQTSSDGVLEVIKIPSDMTLVDAAALYAQGIDNLSTSQAISFLNGSWILNVDRSAGINMSLHYADFKSKSLEDAISNAIQSEELDRGEVTESGDDDGYGNAFSAGTIMISGQEYSWTVSATALNQAYSLSGLPDESLYVGVRIRTA